MLNGEKHLFDSEKISNDQWVPNKINERWSAQI